MRERTCRSCGAVKPIAAFRSHPLRGRPHFCCMACIETGRARVVYMDLQRQRMNRWNNRTVKSLSKKCPGCSAVKPMGAFMSAVKCGQPSNCCLVCRASGRALELHRQHNRRKYRKQAAERMEDARQLLAAFRANGCTLCDESDPCCLVAHHRDPKVKEHGIARLMYGRQSSQHLIAELKKCICLCHNCHYKVHAGKLTVDQPSPSTTPCYAAD